MKSFLYKCAAVAALFVSPMAASAATLEFTLSSSSTYNAGAITSPGVVMRFANNKDYSVLPGDLFGLADFVDATWFDLQNMAAFSANFPNPPLTQTIIDATTVTMGANLSGGGLNTNAGIFSAESAVFGTGFVISWVSPDGRDAVNLFSDLGNRFSVSGNWDSDGFSDSYPWRFSVSNVQWNATATSFQTTMTPVPLPAGGILLLTGLAGMAGLKRRKKSTA